MRSAHGAERRGQGAGSKAQRAERREQGARRREQSAKRNRDETLGRVLVSGYRCQEKKTEGGEQKTEQ